jgi:hypothetical protein
MKHIIAQLDPCKKYDHVSNDDLVQALGFLPSWVVDADHLEMPLKEAMEVQYGFGSLWEMKGGALKDDYVYTYDGDPDLYPLCVIKRGDEIFLQYEHAICVFKQSDGSIFVTRLD